WQRNSADKEFCALYKSVPQVKEHFVVERQIGCGTFSNVYLARLKNSSDATNPTQFALKHIFSTSHPKRVEYEIKCLKDMGGQLNVVGIDGCLRNNGEIVIIMPYVPHDKFSVLLKELTMEEIREYMRKLLQALYRVHGFNVIHRDVKPNNFLFDRETKLGGLVDFGLAQEVRTLPTTHRRTSSPNIVSSASQLPSKRVSNSNNPTPPDPKRRCLGEIQQNQILKQNVRKGDFGKSATVKPRTLQISKSYSSVLNYSPVNLNLQQKVRYLSLTSPNDGRTTTIKRRSSDLFTPVKSLKTYHRKSPLATNNNENKCDCHGKLSVCKLCLARPSPVAPRAGTSGFRPPEVLLRYPNQTTAVDIWSAGIIFLSLLSGCCPFFRPADDIDSLAQLALVFGSKRIGEVAKLLGKTFTCSTHFPGYDLRGLVTNLRDPKTDGPSLRPSPKKRIGSPLRGQKSPTKVQRSLRGQPSPTKAHRSPSTAGLKPTDIPDSAFELLSSMLDCNPHTRFSAIQCLNHEFFFTA
uniref:non-specific serine/threonine protein kinase n=1 Tax=Ciona savignyi TaxID=51511 RepID=H2YQF2_CIOSA